MCWRSTDLQSGMARLNADVNTSPESSMTSHVLAFLADDSGLRGGVPLPMPVIFDRARAGGPGDRRSVEP